MHGMTVLCWLCIMNQWLLGYKFYWTDWEQLLYSLGPHGKILFIEEKRICLGYRHVGSWPYCSRHATVGLLEGGHFCLTWASYFPKERPVLLSPFGRTGWESNQSPCSMLIGGDWAKETKSRDRRKKEIALFRADPGGEALPNFGARANLRSQGITISDRVRII